MNYKKIEKLFSPYIKKIIYPKGKTLRFNKNQEFNILQITDLHYGEDDELDLKNMEIQEKLLNKTKPDLAIITGDLVSGHYWDRVKKDFFLNCWLKCTNSFIKNEILYAMVLGNHDVQADLNTEEILQLDKMNPFALSQDNRIKDDKRLSNYNLEIFSSFEKKLEDVTSLIWIFDTGDTGCKHIKNSYGCISNNQINWYKNETEKKNKKYNKKINGLSFFHIPTPEFMELWNKEKTYLDKGEMVGCPKLDTGFFDEVKNENNIKAFFCGHDHNNDYGGTYEAVELVYGRKTGYGSYGPPKGKQRGGRLINLKEFMNEDGSTDFSFKHRIIQEDGSFVENGEEKWQGDVYFQKEGFFEY